MAEQEKLEEVIKGMRYCLDVQSEWEDARYVCPSCPYSHNGIPCETLAPLMEDALVMLKAQEPRVMTLSGVRNLKQSTPIWLEDVDKKDVIGALFMEDYSGTKCVGFAIVRDWEFKRVVADYMDYGIRWRCWTSHPTMEQREATSWND